MEVSVWFIVVFALLWAAGPLTQVLFLVAPKLHHRLGLTEANAFKPEFKWFLLDEKALAIADMTYLVAGIAFVWLAMLDIRLALIFGMYTCACYVYIALISIPRWLLLIAPYRALNQWIRYDLIDWHQVCPRPLGSLSQRKQC